MTLSRTTLGAIPRLNCYADAASREEHTKPVRGDKYKTKPLGRRNQKYLHIKRQSNGDICIYYQYNPAEAPPLIRYRPDGDVVILPTAYGNKASTNEIIGAVLGMYLETYQSVAWVRLGGVDYPLRNGPKGKWDNARKVYLYPDPSDVKENIFRREPSGGWVYTNPPSMVRHHINRKGSNAVRARYREFLDYAVGIAKLRPDWSPNYVEVAAALGIELFEDQARYHWTARQVLPPPVGDRNFKHGHAAKLCALMRSESLEDHYKAFVWMAWDNHGNPHSTVIKAADRVLMMHHYDEMLVRVEGQVSSKTHDRYAWAIPSKA